MPKKLSLGSTPVKKRGERGSGTIYELAERGLWAAEFDLGKGPDGKRRRRKIYAGSRAALQRKIADERARGGGTIRPQNRGTLAEFVQEWLNEDVKPNRSAATHASYEGIWRVHVGPILGNTLLDRLTVDRVTHLTKAMRAMGTSASMIARSLRVMHRALQVAIRQGRYHNANPFGMVDRPRANVRETRSLTLPEARRFIEASSGDRFEALWLILLTAGLRIGEALALRWKDVDFDTASIAVRRSLSEVGDKVEFKGPKNKSSIRAIQFGAMARAALLRRLAIHDAEGHDSDLIFSTTLGTPMRRSNLRRSHFAPLLKAAGITNLRIHDLRHSMTSVGLAAGINSKVLAERLGHSTTRMTEDRYAHVMPGQQRAAADAIESALSFQP